MIESILKQRLFLYFAKNIVKKLFFIYSKYISSFKDLQYNTMQNLQLDL